MSDWILRSTRPEGATLDLVVFPYAGGGASVFRNWHEALAPYVAVHAVQPPGRENRLAEEPLRSYAELLPELTAVIEGLGAGRLAFFGHSAGAHLAFATAQRLRLTGGPVPEHMLISGRMPIHRRRFDERLSELDDAALTETMTRRSGQTVLPFPELFEMMLPTTRADILASETWPVEDPRPLEARLSLLSGTGDGWTDPQGMMGWQELIAGETTHMAFAGDHFFITSNEAAVLDFVRQELAAGQLGA